MARVTQDYGSKNGGVTALPGTYGSNAKSANAGNEIGSGAPSYLRINSSGKVTDTRDFSYTPAPPTPKYSSGGGGGGGGYSEPSNNYYNDLMSTFMSQSAAARDAAIEAIVKQLEATKGTYNSQIDDVNNEYSRLIDENEVRKDRARRVVRENQANRGQLDTGLGRQEQLNLNVGYDNITSNLKSANTKAVNDIMNLIAQAEAEAEANKANVRNNYTNSLLQFRLANM